MCACYTYSNTKKIISDRQPCLCFIELDEGRFFINASCERSHLFVMAENVGILGISEKKRCAARVSSHRSFSSRIGIGICGKQDLLVHMYEWLIVKGSAYVYFFGKVIHFVCIVKKKYGWRSENISVHACSAPILMIYFYWN